MSTPQPPTTEGIASLLDTDLYKLTMQCAVLKSYPDVDVTYAYTNRTSDLKFTRRGFEWLLLRVSELSELRLSSEELEYLKTTCPFLPQVYLDYLSSFRFRPDEQTLLRFSPVGDGDGDGEGDAEQRGDVSIEIKGKWVETILYEIPLLELVSEGYFRFGDRDWGYEGQEEKAFDKGMRLLSNGCIFSDFGTRRRRSYHTQDIVLQGLVRASKEYTKNGGGPGQFLGTSNVHFAQKYGFKSIGTVAHEWFMGIAAITGDYKNANEIGLQKWIDCFGQGVLPVALTDTFSTRHFLKSFRNPSLSDPSKRYSDIFTAVRQDSGDPEVFVHIMREFYDSLALETGGEEPAEEGTTTTRMKKKKEAIVFSDSLDVELCCRYRVIAEEHGFLPSFGVGTFLTNDFTSHKTQKRSPPLNIVIKLSSASGNHAVKISDDILKNTGDRETVEWVKREVLGCL